VLFADGAITPLSGLSLLAVVLFTFYIGLHLDFEDVTRHGRLMLTAGIGSFAVPTLAGVASGYWIARNIPEALGAVSTDWQFAAGFGICLGVTALPVLGAILRELKLLESEIGRFALACAALNDGVLWILLSALLFSAKAAHTGALDRLTMLGFFAAYLVLMMMVVRPTLSRWLEKKPLSESRLIGLVAIVFTSALITEVIGLHYVLGGFIAGLILPRHLAHDIAARIETVTLLLLPFFFLTAALRTDIGNFGPAVLLLAAIATTVGLVGKVFGTAVPARLCGHSWRQALALGALMQTKGLMEVVVLTILLDAAIVSPATFTALLIMTLVTTTLAKPLAVLALPQPAPLVGSEST
jgi:Kef-type K+ transport system membrane component KefB